MHGNESRVIQVLIAEDSEDDALLIKRELTRGGYDTHMVRVDSAPQMQQALQNQSWDLIITDHNMPSFDSIEALELANTYGDHTPFILVSGSIGEEVAVDAMKAGAHDYVMKNNLARLLPAIERELKEAENRRAHQEAEALIRHMAFHDSLTDLINRAEFERRLDESVQSATTDGEAHALLYLDLDQFKLVNDSCGHMAGDELLKRITRRLQSAIRDSDTLARLGGDEFGVLLKNCPLERAQNIARGLLDTIQSYTFIWSGNSFKIGVSIGLVQVKGDIPSAELLTLADMACYIAKDEGRNRIHVTTDSDSSISRRQGEVQWIQRLQEGMANDNLVLYRQHIQSLQKTPSHSELLLRMLDHDGSIIGPDRFIPAAERYNLMPEVDRWVIEHAFSQFKLQHPAGATNQPFNTLFINLSASSLSDRELVTYIQKQMEQYNIAPQNFGFEITETAAITDFDNAISLIFALQKLGCKVALDDFGTGMSSFSYLKSLNVDFVKIDGSFVKNMMENEMDCAIVESVNKIGHIAGLQTIAEYVENDAIMQRLCELGIDFAQGWAIHRPEPYTQYQTAIAQ
jgi:diguanylate cyclase (GGDEF)-like protein